MLLLRLEQPCTGWKPPDSEEMGGDAMTTFESMYLMLTFGTFLIALLAYIDKRK